MSDDNVIKEFLVGLGWKVDSNGERKFHQSMMAATLKAKLLGDTIEAALKKLLSLSVQVADSFDQMFYASGRINASVANIKSFQNAVSMLGGTLQGAQQSLENLGRFLRVNPGGAHFIESLGVSLQKANGQLKDTSELLEDVVKASKGKPYGVQMRIAEILGVDENTWRAAMSGDLTKLKEKTKDIYARLGLDLDKAAKDGREFANQMRTLQTTLEAISDKVIANLIGKDGKGPLKDLTDWVQANGDSIAKSLTALAEALLRVVENLIKWLTSIKPEDLKKVTDWFENLGVDTGKAQTALDSFAKFIAGAWVLSILAAFAKVRFGWLGLLALLMTAGDVDKDGKLHPTFNPNPEGGDPDLNGAGKMGDWLREKWRNRPGWLGGMGSGAHLSDRVGRGGGPVGKWWTPERMKYATDYLVKNAGLTPMGAAGLVARWAGVESRGGPGSVNPYSGAAGIGQWLGSRKGGFQLGDFDSQLAKAARELNSSESAAARVLRHANSYSEAARGASMFERAEGYNPRTGVDNFTERTPVKRVYEAVNGDKKEGIFSALKKMVSPSAKADESDKKPIDADTIKKKFSAPPDIRPQSWNSSTNVNQNIVNNVYGAGDVNATAAEITLSHARANRQLANLIRNTNGAAA